MVKEAGGERVGGKEATMGRKREREVKGESNAIKK